MSGEKKSERQTILHVGNTWIMTQSKSRPGHVYYFNTLTGEAVWNLSETDRQKGKVGFKNLYCQPDSRPEPKDNPPPQEIFNKDFDKPNIFHQGQQLLNNVPQGPPPAVPCSNIPVAGLSTFNDMNNQINAFNLIGNPTVFKHNPWNIPPAQQFFIPSIRVVNQEIEPSLNVEYNQQLHNAKSESSSFNVYNAPNNNRRFQWRNKFGRGGGFVKSQTPRNRDLRQHLSLKRRLGKNPVQVTLPTSENTKNYNVNESSSSDIDAKSANIDSNVANSIGGDQDTDELSNLLYKKAEIQESQIEENSINLDLTALKRLAPPNTDSKVWYIVVDYKVLLQEFEYLNNVMNSDGSCCLLIPDNEMIQLKDYIACSNNIPARRIFQSLTRKIDSGCVLIGPKSTQEPGDSISNPILKTCFGLIKDNKHVVLLTNDSELLNYKNFIKLNMYNVEELKSILRDSLHPNQSNCDVPLHTEAPTIEPLLENESPITKNLPDFKSPEQHLTMTENQSNDIIVDETKLETTETSQATEVSLPLKCTVNVEIQTDKITAINKDTDTDALTSKTQENLTSDSNKIENLVLESGGHLPIKRREIKLKSNISNQPTSSSSEVKDKNKKPFRWRRKRPAICQEPTPDKHPTNLNNDVNVSSDHTKTTNEYSNNENGTEQTLNSSEAIESRESSVIHVSEKRDNITIEETSTSGIISNTESNVDAENEYIDQNGIQFLESNRPSNECVVGNDSEFLEESFKTNCEEWVFRFVQIMEEALAVILHEPLFSNVEIPPPWSLLEATQCIEKYCENANVRRATDNFLRILLVLCDNVGKITKDMQSQQYMEMHDAGAALLTSLKAILKCEDIEIGEEALRKLFLDINNPYYGSNYPVTDQQESSQMSHDVDDLIGDTKCKEDASDQSPKKYNLRSKSKTSIQEPVVSPPPVKIIRTFDVKSSFLSNLNLQKSSPTFTNVQSDKLFNSESRPSESACVTFSSAISNDILCSKSLNAPTVVRNFSKCEEFEERLRKKFESNALENHDDYMDEDYLSTASECCSDDAMSDEDDLQTDPNVTQLYESSDLDMSKELIASSPKSVDPSLVIENNSRFKYTVCVFLKEVRSALNAVKLLCDKCYTELAKPKLPIGQRNELKMQVQNAQLHIFNLCLSLESMLDRDPNAPADNLQSALKKAGINLLHIDEQLLSRYWETISNCKKQADVFRLSIQEIIVGFNSFSD